MFDFFKIQEVSQKKAKVQIARDFENIPAIAKYFKKETGIDFNNQLLVFKSKVTTFCKTHNISSFSECLEVIHTNKELHQELIDYLTTNESFFYREIYQIKSLVQDIKTSNKNVKILCAPSANGEEPYSIAIALLSSGVSENKFSIVGIDISLEAVEKSKKALYNEKAMRNLSSDLRLNYFKKENNLYQLNTKVKNQVKFKCINIFDTEFTSLGKFDYIFSRNMLIYFDTQTRIKAQNILKKHLVDSQQEIYYGHADLTHEHS